MTRALVLTDRGDAEYIELPAADPERALQNIVGSPLDSLVLTHLAEHLILWVPLEPQRWMNVQAFGHNDVATQIASAGVGVPRPVVGTAVLTANTVSGTLAALSPRDCAALDRILTEIYTGYTTG